MNLNLLILIQRKTTKVNKSITTCTRIMLIGDAFSTQPFST